MHRARLVLVSATTAFLLSLTGTAGTAGALGAAPSRVAQVAGSGSSLAEARARVAGLARSAGLQLGPKHRQRPTVTIGGRRYLAANPSLAQLPPGAAVDLSYWRRLARERSARRAVLRSGPRGRAGQRAVPTPRRYVEQEAATALGVNDTPATSEHLLDVGTGEKFAAARISGRLSARRLRIAAARTREDQGSIGRATRTGVGAGRERVVVRSRIGDGPHGRARSRRGDFDFFRVRAAAGHTITADTAGSRMDTILALYDASGRVLAANDDAGDDAFSSMVDHRVAATGWYYVMVAGFNGRGDLPANPFRSGSGAGAGSEGRYRLDVSASRLDSDLFGVRLESGDVLAGSATGGAHRVAVHRVDGEAMVGSQYDLSFIYPASSPLPGGGATFAYVAEQPGWYAVSADQGSGAYRLLLETYRASAEVSTEQTIFLDFDGERLNTAPLYGYGVRTLSPMQNFLPRWGLEAADRDALIDATVAAVKEDLVTTLELEGLNDDVRVTVLNSRDHADPFGQPGVSRVVVGGTIRQTGIPAIGIAASIDPGNFEHEETALLMLDELSRKAGAEQSLNTYLTDDSDRVGFVGRVLGTLVAHETGHLIGNFHTDNADSRRNVMDAGGAGYASLYGVGRDRVGGTGDDPDVDFAEGILSRQEGLTGLEDTLNNSAWAFVGQP